MEVLHYETKRSPILGPISASNPQKIENMTSDESNYDTISHFHYKRRNHLLHLPGDKEHPLNPNQDQ